MCDEVEIEPIEPIKWDNSFNLSDEIERIRQEMIKAILIPKEILHEKNRTDEG